MQNETLHDGNDCIECTIRLFYVVRVIPPIDTLLYLKGHFSFYSVVTNRNE